MGKRILLLVVLALLLCAPAFHFGPPTSLTWPEEAGYQTVVLVKQEGGPWGMWGNLHGISEDARWSLLRKSGDFLVRGNLELFDVASWRRIGKTLSDLKREGHMGERLGLVRGGRKGRSKARKKVLGAREFRHSLSTLINGMVAQRLQVLHIREWPTGDVDAEPGSFEHLAAHAPPWLTIWARLVDGSG